MELKICRKDWIIKKLGDFAISEKGKKPKNQSDIKTEIFKYPYVDIKAFEQNIIDSYTDGIKCNFCTEDDFLMVWDGSRSGLVGKAINGAIGSTLVKINLPCIEDYFAYYFLKSKYVELNTNAKGTGTPHVNPDLLWNYDFPIVPILEQKAIVAKIEQLFSELDNGIQNLKIAQQKLKIYRQAVLKKAFEGELTKEWREKQTNLPTADGLLKKIKKEREEHYQKQLEEWKESVKKWENDGKNGKKPSKPRKQKNLNPLEEEELKKLPKIPQLWIYDYLAYAGELGRGKSKHRPRNDKQLFGGKYPFIQTAEVKAAKNKEITNYSKSYNEFGLAQSKLWKKGTLCITIAANIADTAFLGIDACFPDSVVGYTPFHNIINAKYIDYFFKTTKEKISAYAPATAQKNINLTTLENLVIPYCSLEEQTKIVQEIESRLSVCDNIEATITNALKKAEALRQSILKKAFEGKLLTEEELKKIKNHPDFESAEKLLEKIKQERQKNE